MGINAEHVRTARKYVLLGEIKQQHVELISKRILANDCIEEVVVGDSAEPPSPHLEPYELKINNWPVCDLDDEGLVALSKDKDLFLNLVEMKTIQKYYQDLGREPTDVELETLAPLARLEPGQSATHIETWEFYTGLAVGQAIDNVGDVIAALDL